MLNVEGRNIADEGFSGSNVRDSNTGRFTSEGANKLAQSVRSGMSMTSSRDSSATNISVAVSKLTEAISNDTQSFQELLNNQNEETKKLFNSYIKSLESGKTSNIEKAMEKFLLSMEKDTSKKFEKIIDAVGQRKSLNEGNTVKQKFANFMGADADKGFGGSIAQAFSEPGRMFGTNRGFLGTGLFSGGPSAAQQQATAELGKENQTKGIAELVTNLSDNSENESVSKIQSKNNKEKVAETGSSNKKGPEKVIIADQPIITKDAPKTVSGIDRNDPAAEQLQVLKDILAELKIISGKPSGGLGGGLGSIIPDIDLPSRRPRTSPRTGPRTGPRPGPGRLGNLGRFARGAGRFLGPVGLGLTAGMAAYDGFKGFNADEDATLGQKFQNAGRNIGSGLTFGLIDSVEEKMEDGSYQADREAENSQQSLQEAADRAGENGPQRQQRQARIDARNTAIPTVTNPTAGITAIPTVTNPTATTPQTLQEAADRAGENGPQRQQRQARIDARNTTTSTISNQTVTNSTTGIAATPIVTNSQSSREAADRAGENGPQRQQRQARIDARNTAVTGQPRVQETNRGQTSANPTIRGTATPAVATTPTVLPLIDGPTPPPFVIPEGFEPLIDGNGKIITELGFSNSPQQLQSINSGSVTQSPSVTSNAIQNMTNLSTSSTQSAPTIINNITNNNTSASPAAPQILTTPSTPRNNSNIIQRFQDRTFAGI